MFWGNWLHSASFSIGFVLSLIATAMFIGGRTGAIFLCILAFLCVIFFWTFPGWLILHHFIWNIVNGGGPG